MDAMTTFTHQQIATTESPGIFPQAPLAVGEVS
jgi:hypothetical protein